MGIYFGGCTRVSKVKLCSQSSHGEQAVASSPFKGSVLAAFLSP